MLIDDPTWINVCVALFANPMAQEMDRAACRGLLQDSPPFMSWEAVALCSVAMMCLTYLATHWPRRAKA